MSRKKSFTQEIIDRNQERIRVNTRVKEFMANVRPLDLIVFKGSEYVSKFIIGMEKITTGHGEFSHIELAISRDWCPAINPLATASSINLFSNGMLSWGSTMSGRLNDGVVNVESNRAKFGVQVRSLEKLVRNYITGTYGQIGVLRLLDNPIDHSDDSIVRAKLVEAYNLYNGTIYNVNCVNLAASMCSCFRPMRECLNTCISHGLFCSEFVAEVYKHIGVLSADVKSQNVLPTDFYGRDSDADIPEGLFAPVIIWA